MKKKIALLDFDGTLSQGFVSMAFLDWLFKVKIYPADLYRQQIKLAADAKRGEVSYEKWCRQWGILWAKGLAGQTIEQLEKVAQDFFQNYKSKIYPSSYQLINLLKAKKYLTVMVSTGAFEVAKLAGQELRIDEIYGTKILTQDNQYADRLTTRLHLPSGKKEFIEQIIESRKYEMNASAAFGDSIHDASMLERVKFPVALNPSVELQKLAQENNWFIFNYQNVVEKIKELLP